MIALSPYVALAASMFASLFYTWRAGALLLALAALTSLYSGAATTMGLLPLVAFGGILAGSFIAESKTLRVILLCVAALGGLAIAIHIFPGFNSLVISKEVYFGRSAQAYSLGASFDKWAVGAVLLLFWSRLKATQATLSTVRLLLCATFPLILICTGLIVGVPIDPKFNRYVAIFLMLNLVTCVVEEAYFRLLIQERLNTLFHPMLSVFIAAAVFAGAHYSPVLSTATVGMFTLGGVLYALAYHVTKSLPVTIAVHFMSNAMHILLLMYPLS